MGDQIRKLKDDAVVTHAKLAALQTAFTGMATLLIDQEIIDGDEFERMMDGLPERIDSADVLLALKGEITEECNDEFAGVYWTTINGICNDVASTTKSETKIQG